LNFILFTFTPLCVSILFMEHKALTELKSHPWLGRLFKKLTKSDEHLINDFISKNIGLDKSSFEIEINRLFLDKERPKRFNEICEILSCFNSRRFTS